MWGEIQENWDAGRKPGEANEKLASPGKIGSVGKCVKGTPRQGRAVMGEALRGAAAGLWEARDR